MSHTLTFLRRMAILVATCAIVLFLAEFAPTQETRITAKEMEKEINAALGTARKLAKTKPESAYNALKVYQYILDNDLSLPEETWIRLVASVSERAQKIRNKLAKGGKCFDRKLTNLLFLPAAPKPANRGTAEQRFLRRLAKYQNMPRRNTTAIFIRKRPDDDIPPYWQALREKKLDMKPKLTMKGQHLRQAMKQKISVNYQRMTLKKVIEDLQQRTGQTITVEANALQDARISLDIPIVLPAQQAKVSAVLRDLFDRMGLSYVLKNDAIVIMSYRAYLREPTLQSYSLTRWLGPPDPRFDRAYNRAREQAIVHGMMKFIIDNAEPPSWSSSGGRGLIWYEATTKTLHIRQSALSQQRAWHLLEAYFRR